MILSMPGQAWLFLSTVVAGMVIGLFYDIFRIIRKTTPHRAWVVQLEDVLFWVIATGAMFYFMLQRNFGEIRVFSLLGAAIGAVLYMATLSPVVLKVSVAVIDFVKRVVITTVNIILFPIKFLYNLIFPPIRKFLVKRRKNLRTAVSYGKIQLKKTSRNWFILRKKI